MVLKRAGHEGVRQAEAHSREGPLVTSEAILKGAGALLSIVQMACSLVSSFMF